VSRNFAANLLADSRTLRNTHDHAAIVFKAMTATAFAILCSFHKDPLTC